MQGPGGLLNIVTLPAGATQTQARMVIDGTRGAIFLYKAGSPFGGLVASWAASGGQDPYANFYPAGLNAGGTVIAGTAPNPQIQLSSSGGTGIIDFITNNVNFTDSTIRENISSFVQLLIAGGHAITATHTDSVAVELNSSDGVSSAANLSLIYNDAASVGHFYETIDSHGVSLSAVNQIFSTKPGTGTNAGNPATGETWHTATLINNWTTSGGGVGGLRYRMLPIQAGVIEIEFDMLNTVVASGNSICFTLPAGYHPPAARNRGGVNWNNPSVNNSATVPWVFVNTNGDIQITAIEAGPNIGIFGDIFIPMD